MLLLSALVVATYATPVVHRGPKGSSHVAPSIIGAWRSKVQFLSGPYAAVKDLKFLLVLNAGGTLTESSNYDGAPPSPPAYGIWRKIGRDQYELRYEFFNLKPPTKFEDITNGGGWTSNGIGVLKEKLKLSPDGQTFVSEISFVLREESGRAIQGIAKAKANAERMKF